MWAWSIFTALVIAVVAIPMTVSAADAPTSPLVEIDGQALADDDVERPVALQVFQLEARAHALRRRAVNDAIARYLLAREAEKRGLSVNALVAQEVDARVTPPSAEEVNAEVSTRIQKKPMQGEALEELRASVEATKRAQRRAAQHAKYVATLRDQARIVVRLPDEPALRMVVATAGEPALGPPDAPVVIVEFGDFQCPFCRAAQSTLKTLRERYGDRLRFVHRDFPVDTHPAARRAAEAARCAGEQNAFWTFHDAAYAAPLTGGDAELTAIARRLSLDTSAFTTCLESKRHVTTVQRGVLDGKAAGVSGTPTFFINGRPLVGAVPLEEFQAAIERELTRRPLAAAERTPKP